MPYPVKHPVNIALQIVEFVALFALAYGVCFVLFPAFYHMLLDIATIMVNSQLGYL